VTRASWVALRLLQAPAQSVGGLPRAERAPLGRLARHLPPQPRLCCWSSKGLLANLANCRAGLCTAWVPSVYHHIRACIIYIYKYRLMYNVYNVYMRTYCLRPG
jgi:hypothetical protein